MNKFNFCVSAALCCGAGISQSFAAKIANAISNYNVDDYNNLCIPEPTDFNTFINDGEHYKLDDVSDADNATCFRLFPDNSRFKEGDAISEDRQNEIASYAAEHKDAPLFLGIGDIHGAYTRYKPITRIVEKAVDAHPNGFFVCIAGDMNRKHDLFLNKNSNDVNFISGKTRSFLIGLVKIIKKRNPNNEVFLTLGNHDTKFYGGSIGKFVDTIENDTLKGLNSQIRVLTNTPLAFNRENFLNKDYLTTVSYIMGNIAVIPYMGNFAQTGLDAEGATNCKFAPLYPDAPEHEFTEEWRNAFEDFYQDKKRLGLVDKIFKGGERGTIGDPSQGLTLVAQALADTWFKTVQKLGEKSGPLEVMTIAHDHFLRPLVLLELVSKYCPEYRLSPEVLERLKITLLAAHELPAYMFDHDLFLWGTDNKVHRIPCRTGANGVYGEACSLFVMPDSNIDDVSTTRNSFKLDDLKK